MMPPTSIDGTDITAATIDGTDVTEITVDGDTVFSAQQLPLAYSDLTNWYPFDANRFGGSNTDDVTSIISGSGDNTNYSLTVDGPTFQTNVGPTEYGKNAFDFNHSTEDRLIIDGAFGFGDTSERTVSAWATYDNSTSGFACLYGDYDSIGVNILRYESGNGGLQVFSNNLTGDSVSGFPRQSYGWKLWTFTYDGSNFRAYFDGVKKDTLGDGPPVSGGDNFKIGNRGGKNIESWGGYISDFRIYNRALSDSEVNQIYQNTKP